MKFWLTQFKAINIQTGEMQTWIGQIVEAPTQKMAQEWCYHHAGHLEVVGELVSKIPQKNGVANFEKRVDY